MHLDRHGFYWSFRSKATDKFQFIYQFDHAIFLKGWKVALVSAKLPTPPRFSPNQQVCQAVSLECVVHYPKLKDPKLNVGDSTSYDVAMKRFTKNVKSYDRSKKAMDDLMRLIQRDLNQDGALEKIEIKMEREGEEWVIIHDNAEAPQINFTFNEAATTLLGFPKSTHQYQIAARKKNAHELMEEGVAKYKREAKAKFKKLEEEGKAPEGGWSTLLPPSKEWVYEPEKEDKKVIYNDSQLKNNVSILYKYPKNVRIHNPMQYNPCEIFSKDPTLRMGQMIPYADLWDRDFEEASGFHEVPHLRYYHVHPKEFHVITFRVVDEDGGPIHYYYNRDERRERIELTYHFLPPERGDGEDEKPYPATLEAYNEMFGIQEGPPRKRRKKSDEEENQSGDTGDADFAESSSISLPSSETNMYELARAAGFNKITFTSKASIAAGFGH